MSHSLLTKSVSLTVCLCLVIIFNVEEVETCGVSEFECNNGNCIVSSLRCDNNFDCLDSSDELNCDTQVNCPEGGTRCPDNTCAVNIAACSSQTTEETDTNNAENDRGCSTICLIGIILGVFGALLIIACVIAILFIKKRSNIRNKVENTEDVCVKKSDLQRTNGKNQIKDKAEERHSSSQSDEKIQIADDYKLSRRIPPINHTRVLHQSHTQGISLITN